MDCCHLEGIEMQFNRKKALQKLNDYRKDGPQKTTRILVNALQAIGVQDLTLLDIGGGIGAIQHELLKAGIRQATNLEASSAYLEACQMEAERQGFDTKIQHIHGDFANMHGAPSADIVTLERVICCYPDMPGLVTQSCEKAKQLLGLVYPHEAWWVKIGMALIYNLALSLSRSQFRVFLHSTQKVDALIRSRGFERQFFQITGPWQVVVYQRA